MTNNPICSLLMTAPLMCCVLFKSLNLYWKLEEQSISKSLGENCYITHSTQPGSIRILSWHLKQPRSFQETPVEPVASTSKAMFYSFNYLSTWDPLDPHWKALYCKL